MEKTVQGETETGLLYSERSSNNTQTHSNHAAIYRKLDIRIIPLAFLCYFLQFLDKVIINYARIMGLESSLNMHGQDFSWMATALFIAYAVAEFPQSFLLQKFPISKVLGLNILCWGILVCCSAAAQDFAGMLVLRTLLGAFEAVIGPALVLITSQFYTKIQAAPRMGIWYCGLGLGQLVGGLISWAGQHGSQTSSFEGWRIMMLCLGVFNLALAPAVVLLLPDTVRSAKFLTSTEKEHVQMILSEDQAGNGAKGFNKKGLFEALLDPALWLLVLISILTVIPSGVITSFSASLIAGFGYDSKQAALLNMPSGAISILATVLNTFAVLFDFPRWLSIVSLLIPAIIGGALMSFASGTQGGALAGIYLVNFTIPPLALVYALIGANIHGYTKKIVASAAVQIGFGIANIIGPQTFQAREAPEYVSAKIVVLAVDAGAIVVAVLLRLLYGYRNKKRAHEEPDESERIVEDDLTDFTTRGFRYAY